MTTEAQQTRTEEITVESHAPREPITAARARELFEDAQYAPWGYTGRGMRGDADCLAVSTDSASEAVTVILDVVQACAENGTAEDVVELVNLLRGSRTESLGRGIVVYWPDIAWMDCGEETDEGEGEGVSPDNEDEYLDSARGSRGDREDFHSDG